MENMAQFTCLAVFCLFVAGVAAQTCDEEALVACTNPMSTADPGSRCKIYLNVKSCLEDKRDTCSSKAQYTSLVQGAEMFGAGCVGGAGSNSGAGGMVSPDSCLMETLKCMEVLNDNGGNISDPTKMCVNYDQFKACWDPIVLKCKDDQQFISQKANYDGMIMMCESKCDMTQLQGCLTDFQKVEMSSLSTIKEFEAGCVAIKNFQDCFAPVYESCKTVIIQQPDNAKMIQQQQEMVEKMRKLICVDNLPKLKEYGPCIDNDTVQAGFRKCEKMYGSPKMDDKGMPMEETEKEQCTRMSEMSNCLTTTISACGEKVTEIFVNVNREMMKIKVAGEKLECPTDAAAGFGGHVWMIVFTVAIATFFY